MAFSTADVRSFMARAFSAGEIETLCFDHFPDVYNLFTPEMTKSDKIQHLIEYCVRRERAADLLVALQGQLPDQVRAVFGSAPFPAQFEPDGARSEPPAPSVETHAALLGRLVAAQQSALRTYIGLAVGLVLAGIVVGVGGALVVGPQVPPELSGFVPLGSGFGGLFIASLSLLQIREIVTRRDRLGIFAALQSQVALLAARGSVDAPTWERIDSLVWQAVAKTAAG